MKRDFNWQIDEGSRCVLTHIRINREEDLVYWIGYSSAAVACCIRVRAAVSDDGGVVNRSAPLAYGSPPPTHPSHRTGQCKTRPSKCIKDVCTYGLHTGCSGKGYVFASLLPQPYWHYTLPLCSIHIQFHKNAALASLAVGQRSGSRRQLDATLITPDGTSHT